MGVWMRSSGSGSTSASERATIPDPARYQPIEATIAPGVPNTAARWSRRSSVSSNPGPDQWRQKCARYARTAAGSPSRICSTSGSWWKAWYQNSRSASAVRTRSPAPGSGGERTSARTESGALLATAWAMRLPMS